jgi:hypothetical protein
MDPTSKEFREIEGSLEFSWEETLRGLNIGNRAPYRPQNSLSQSSDILFEDVLSSEVLADGSLFTRKLIQKPLGSARFLEPFIAPFGISLPTTTNVLEDSVVCPKTKTSWQWSRNLKSQNPEYLGYPEYQWLELSERATYLSLYPKTFYYKKCLAQSYLTGRMAWLGLQKSMTSKGATRWTQRSGGQVERLINETQRQIDASSPPLENIISIGLQKNREKSN